MKKAVAYLLLYSVAILCLYGIYLLYNSKVDKCKPNEEFKLQYVEDIWVGMERIPVEFYSCQEK